MSLRGVKVLLRMIGALFLLFGLYLIFFQKQFFGLFLIIGAVLILPSLEDSKINDNNHKAEEQFTAYGEEKTSKVVKSESGSDS